jgi:hypothetical protein
MHPTLLPLRTTLAAPSPSLRATAAAARLVEEAGGLDVRAMVVVIHDLVAPVLWTNTKLDALAPFPAVQCCVINQAATAEVL